jgi:hypothetical protein
LIYAALGVLSIPNPSVREARACRLPGAGPTAASIQGVVAYRAALGEPNNGNGPAAAAGRREINWDGAGQHHDATGHAVQGFVTAPVDRGGLFTTPGTGLSRRAVGPRAAWPRRQPDLREYLPDLQRAATVGSRITRVLFCPHRRATPAVVTPSGRPDVMPNGAKGGRPQHDDDYLMSTEG